MADAADGAPAPHRPMVDGLIMAKFPIGRWLMDLIMAKFPIGRWLMD
jgi:hypothetical protein